MLDGALLGGADTAHGRARERVREPPPLPGLHPARPPRGAPRGARRVPRLPHLRRSRARRPRRATTAIVAARPWAPPAIAGRPSTTSSWPSWRTSCSSRVPGEQETDLALRFQQLSGPVMAKAVEDTAFYRYAPLASLNEVGGDPGRPGDRRRGASTTRAIGAGERLARSGCSPSRPTTRSGREDVRARINVLCRATRGVGDDGAPLVRPQRARQRDGWPDRHTGVARLPDARRRLADRRRADRRLRGEGGPRGQGPHVAGSIPTRTTTPRSTPSSRAILDDAALHRRRRRPSPAASAATGRVNSLAQKLLTLTAPGRPRPLPGHGAVGPLAGRPGQPPPGGLRTPPRGSSSWRRSADGRGRWARRRRRAARSSASSTRPRGPARHPDWFGPDGRRYEPLRRPDPRPTTSSPSPGRRERRRGRPRACCSASSGGRLGGHHADAAGGPWIDRLRAATVVGGESARRRSPAPLSRRAARRGRRAGRLG